MNTVAGVLGYNLFAYCNNNPVKLTDPDGHFPFLAITAAIGAVAAVGSGMAVATAASTSRSVKEFNSKGNWGTVAATAGGAILGG